MSNEEWKLTTHNSITNDGLIRIENINKTKVLEATNDSKVILENFKKDRHRQLWKKGEPNAEGYFTLENCKVSNVMTATSSTSLELKSKKKVWWILPSKLIVDYLPCYFFTYRSNERLDLHRKYLKNQGFGN